MTRRRRDQGFTLIEIVLAMAVLTFVSLMVIGLLSASRRAARATQDTYLAASIAQATFERLRMEPPRRLVAFPPKRQPIPEAGARLRDAALSAGVQPWEGKPDLLHLRVELVWISPNGHKRSILREGLVYHGEADK